MTDTTYIENAARDFDGYAQRLRDHKTTLTTADPASWQSTSAESFRTLLDDMKVYLESMATSADSTASSLRAHATAVQNNVYSQTVNKGVDVLMTPVRVAQRWWDE